MMEGFLVNFDLLRRKTEERMRPGDTSSDSLVAPLCLRNSSLTHHGEYLV